MQEKNRKIEKEIEALLFYAAEPLSLDYLAKVLEVKKEEIKNGLTALQNSIEDRGVVLIEHNGEVSLVTSPETSEVIEKMVQDEYSRDLGRASIETLAIIAYKNSISRKEIEYIRGVNSQFAIRNLLLRGLIEKKSKDSDERVVVYNITMDALMHMGLQKISDLPEYEEIENKLKIEQNTETKEDGE